MAVYLRVAGGDFDIDAYLEKHPCEPDKVYRQGEPTLHRTKPDGEKEAVSGFNMCVSDAEDNELQKAIDEAIEFLSDEDYAEEIQALMNYPGVEGAVLDFSIDPPRASEYPVQYYGFPSELIRLAGELDLSLEVSLYFLWYDQ